VTALREEILVIDLKNVMVFVASVYDAFSTL
jgi:hypothetical protein